MNVFHNLLTFRNILKNSHVRQYLSSKYFTGYVTLLFGLLLLVWLILENVDTLVQGQIAVQKTQPSPFIPPKPADYPLLSKKITENLTFHLSAQAAIIIDDVSKVVLFTKGENLIFPMASTTKLMTALVASEYFKPEEILTVPAQKMQGVTVGFKYGDTISFNDILYAMLLPSGNDAALTIAYNYPGGVNKFVERMNQKANELNLHRTHFVDPTGLDEKNITSIKELVLLASTTIKNPLLKSIVSTKEKVIFNTNGTRMYHLYNLNILLGKDGVDGIKTGFTDEAGQVLVTSKSEQKRTIILAVMKSQDRFADTKELLSKLSQDIFYINIQSIVQQD